MRAPGVDGSEKTADGGRTRAGGVAVGNAGRLLVAHASMTLGNLEGDAGLVGRRLSSAEQSGLLSGQLVVLVLLLLLGLMRHMSEIHGQGVAVLVEQGGSSLAVLLVVTVAGGRVAALARPVGRRGRHLLATRGLLSLLLELAGRVAATILAKVDLELPVLLLSTDSFDSLDGVGNVGEVDKRAALLTQRVDQLNLTVLGEILSQSVFGPGLIEVTNVHIARSTTADSQGNGGRESTRVLAPANLESAVVNHQTLQVAEGIERRSSCGINKGHKADVLVGNVPDVVQKTAANNIANLLDGGLRMNVAEVNGPVAQVGDATGRRGYGSGSDRLLSQGAGNQVTVGTRQHVGIARGDSKVLGGILLLSLGHIGAPVLAIVHPAGRLPLGFLGKLRDGLDGIGNGQEVHKGNVLLAHNLDGINGTKLAEILTKFLLGNVLGQVAEVHISGSTRLLNSQVNRGGHLRGLAPADLDILSLDAELFQDGIRVEVSGRGGVQERDEGAVLIGKKTDRLDLTAANVAQNLLGRSVRGNVAQVHSSTGTSHKTRCHRHGRSRLNGHLQASHIVKRRRGRLGRIELGGAIS